MRYLFVFLLMIAGVGTLVGCGPIYQTEYDYIPPHSGIGKMCAMQCQQNKNTCEQMCQLKNDACRTQARQDAMYRYEMYRHRQRDIGRGINKGINDFNYGNYCDTACNCDSSFRTCYATCGGQVLTQRVCVAFCGK
jgi:hypothetical protein